MELLEKMEQEKQRYLDVFLDSKTTKELSRLTTLN